MMHLPAALHQGPVTFTLDTRKFEYVDARPGATKTQVGADGRAKQKTAKGMRAGGNIAANSVPKGSTAVTSTSSVEVPPQADADE